MNLLKGQIHYVCMTKREAVRTLYSDMIRGEAFTGTAWQRL